MYFSRGSALGMSYKMSEIFTHNFYKCVIDTTNGVRSKMVCLLINEYAELGAFIIAAIC